MSIFISKFVFKVIKFALSIFMFNFQFLDGPAPSAPFPDCGVADVDSEDCEDGNDTCADD